MSVNIDPNFSVYNLTTRVDEQETAHLNHRRTMNVISYAIEDISVVDEVQTRVFAGFQRMSRFLPQVERYTKLAAVAESVYIFGIPDVEVPQIPNLTYIPISKHDRLSREWFLVSYGRDFHSTLATEEISHIDDDDDERVFKGIWTFDLGLNTILENWLTRVVDANPLGINEADLYPDSQQHYTKQILQRLQDATYPDHSTYDEVETVIEADVRPLVMA